MAKANILKNGMPAAKAIGPLMEGVSYVKLTKMPGKKLKKLLDEEDGNAAIDRCAAEELKRIAKEGDLAGLKGFGMLLLTNDNVDFNVTFGDDVEKYRKALIRWVKGRK